MDVCFCIDNNFVPPCIAAIRSIHSNSTFENISIHIIGMKLNKASINALEQLAKDDLNINIYESTGEYQGLVTKGHITSAAYVRFEIPRLLKNINRVLYLDADLIVSDSLKELWAFDLKEHMLAAVENPFFTRHRSLWMDQKSKYFNSGVMLLDLHKVREHRLMERALEHKKRADNQDVFHDQDALNAIIDGKWVELPLRFNLQTLYLRKARELSHRRGDILRSYKKPAIIHYSSGAKPWEFADPHPLRHVFLKYYSGLIIQPNGLKAYVKAIIKWLYLKAFYRYQLK